VLSSIPREDVIVGARFLWKLPSFLRRPITLAEAKATLQRRLENRDGDFLNHAGIYSPPLGA
jgi:hypothetical protein